MNADLPAPAPGAPDAAPVPAPQVAPVLSRTERRERATVDALRTLVRDLYADRFGASAASEEMPLTLRLRARPAANWELAFDPPLAGQLAEQIDSAQAERAVYRPGCVYCYRCLSAACEHARPASALSVFAGYDSAGRPVWQELAQALVEVRDPRVDRLFGRPPGIVAVAQPGHVLRGEQLAAFGRSSKTYAVLGQVIAGYFRCAPAPGEVQDRDARLAVTLQVVETRGARGDLRLHLNALAGLPDGGRLEFLLGTGWEPALHRALDVARRAMEGLEFRVGAARQQGRAEEARALLRQVPGVLHRLAGAVERGERQERRRTRHVEARRQENRPVQKAQEDVRAAGDEALYYDVKARTLMVVGPRGRAHAFSGEGRHVTSFILRPDAVAFRLRTERWRRLDPGEAPAWRARLTFTEERGAGDGAA